MFQGRKKGINSISFTTSMNKPGDIETHTGGSTSPRNSKRIASRPSNAAPRINTESKFLNPRLAHYSPRYPADADAEGVEGGTAVLEGEACEAELGLCGWRGGDV